MEDIKGDFVSGKTLAELFDVSEMTIYRWEKDPDLKFPAPSRVNNRKFWYRPDAIAWMKARTAKKSAAA